MIKIVFLDAMTVGQTSLSAIEALGELVCYPTSTHAEAMERVREAEVIITNKVVIDREVLDAAPSLRLICEAATGVNNIDLEAAASRGIPVRNVAGYSTESVAQLTFALLLHLVCGVAGHDSWIKDGSYSRSPIFTNVSNPYMELYGKTMGIVGMGTIGSRVAQIASAFGMKVVYFSTSGTAHCTDYPCLSLQELLSQSDVVSIHAPLNDRTRGLIGAEQLAMMKRTAYLINIGRGGIVSESDLAQALDREMIAGAGLDVFVHEPLPADNPLLHLDHPERLAMTPHIGWAGATSLERLVAGVAENIKSFQQKA